MTILNVVNETGLTWMVIVGACLCVIGLLCLVIFTHCMNLYSGYCAIIAFVIGGILVIVGVLLPSGETKYEVTLDENVKMVEFYEEWEVVEQRGDIWVIKERKDEID